MLEMTMIQALDIPIPASVGFLRKMASINPLIVNYHVVSDQQLPHIGHLYRYRDIKTFQRDLDFFCTNYTPIGLMELMDYMKGISQLPERAVMFTFDDGFREMFDIVAPILLERSIPATFFLTIESLDNQSLIHGNKKSLLIDHLTKQTNDSKNSELIKLLDSKGLSGESMAGRIRQLGYSQRAILDELASILKVDFSGFLREKKPYLSSSQVKELLENGFTIGGHSVDHANFEELSLGDQIVQAQSSVQALCEQFNLDYRAFAFPYGDLGVTYSFFEAVSESIDISFGTQGLLTDSVTSNFQRLNVEKHKQSASRTTKFHYARRIVYKQRAAHIVQRS